MKKRFSAVSVLALMLLVCVSTFLMTKQGAIWSLQQDLDHTKEVEESSKKFLEAKAAILEQFVEEVDAKALDDGAVRGMVAALGDRWSLYLTAEEYERLLNQNSSFVGIGITAEPDNADAPQALLVVEVFPSSPAEGVGLMPGDEIVAVEGERVGQLGYEEATERIRGAEDTIVRITVRRDGVERDYTIRRRPVERSLIHSEIVDGDIGYIRIQAFDTGARVNDDFQEAVKRIQDFEVKGLILDVRDNPGGDVEVLSSMLDLLLPEGRLITLEYRDGREKAYDSAESSVNLPMAVLINGESVSAAEFFAACLAEYNWAVTVGEATNGKGFAQTDIKLFDDSAIHLSVLRYYTPNHISLAGVGLTPDYTVAQTGSVADLATDSQFQKALEVLREIIPSDEVGEDADAEGGEEANAGDGEGAQ
ncbi:MAG: S41 family peptidase [Oscillospiraceae bacterium]|jgi:carboxyl-terminal processing protease|nr:S41 family peptidase [Oscillospiraceae bacterium]